MYRSNNGFTLIEVLVATTVTALLLTAVYGIFSGLSGNQQQLRRQAENSYLSRVLFDRLGRELRTAVYAPEIDGMVFEGQSDATRMALTFCTSSGTTGGGIVRVQYALRTDQDGSNSLLRRETPLLQQDDMQGWVKLAGGIKALQLRFANGDGWRERWAAGAGSKLPEIVEITLELPSDRQMDTFMTAFEVAPLQTR